MRCVDGFWLQMAYNLQLLPSFLLVDILGVLAQETGILLGRSSGWLFSFIYFDKKIYI